MAIFSDLMQSKVKMEHSTLEIVVRQNDRSLSSLMHSVSLQTLSTHENKAAHTHTHTQTQTQTHTHKHTLHTHTHYTQHFSRVCDVNGRGFPLSLGGIEEEYPLC
jgi:hypothetical protein